MAPGYVLSCAATDIVCTFAFSTILIHAGIPGMSVIETIGAGIQLCNNRYVLEKQLGAGGMGTAWKARDQKLKQDVVVKLPHQELLGNDVALKRFEREISALVDLKDHPNVVDVIDTDRFVLADFGDCPFAVLKFLGGGDLQTRIATTSNISPQQVYDWLSPIADALDAAHRIGIVHRDVKPENILFDGEGRPVLTDFGIAKLATDADGQRAKTITQGIVLTLAYAPPELFTKDKPTGLVDQFSLVAVMYEMLSGKVPFPGDDIMAVVRLQIKPAPRLDKITKIAKPIADVIARGLSLVPEDRFTCCNEMMSQFAKAIAASPAPIIPTQPSAVSKTCPECQRQLPLPTNAEGKKFKCPGCGTPLAVGSGFHVGRLAEKSKKLSESRETRPTNRGATIERRPEKQSASPDAVPAPRRTDGGIAPRKVRRRNSANKAEPTVSAYAPSVFPSRDEWFFLAPLFLVVFATFKVLLLNTLGGSTTTEASLIRMGTGIIVAGVVTALIQAMLDSSRVVAALFAGAVVAGAVHLASAYFFDISVISAVFYYPVSFAWISSNASEYWLDWLSAPGMCALGLMVPAFAINATNLRNRKVGLRISLLQLLIAAIVIAFVAFPAFAGKSENVVFEIGRTAVQWFLVVALVAPIRNASFQRAFAFKIRLLPRIKSTGSASELIHGPSLGLFFVGILNFIVFGWLVVSTLRGPLLKGAGAFSQSPREFNMGSFLLPLVLWGILLAIAVLCIHAARSMRRFRGYSFAVWLPFAACLSPLLPAAAPIAFWNFRRMRRPEVRQEFRQREDGGAGFPMFAASVFNMIAGICLAGFSLKCLSAPAVVTSHMPAAGLLYVLLAFGWLAVLSGALGIVASSCFDRSLCNGLVRTSAISMFVPLIWPMFFMSIPVAFSVLRALQRRVVVPAKEFHIKNAIFIFFALANLCGVLAYIAGTEWPPSLLVSCAILLPTAFVSTVCLSVAMLNDEHRTTEFVLFAAICMMYPLTPYGVFTFAVGIWLLMSLNKPVASLASPESGMPDSGAEPGEFEIT